MTINNNIQETLVSFEVAKLLKEKGFLVEMREYYDKDSVLFYSNYFRDNITVDERKEGFISAPTQQLAIDWIRVNFGIHIYVSSKTNNDGSVFFIAHGRYIPTKKDSKGFEIDPILYNPKYTPEEAKEVALLYTLKNLI